MYGYTFAYMHPIYMHICVQWGQIIVPYFFSRIPSHTAIYWCSFRWDTDQNFISVWFWSEFFKMFPFWMYKKLPFTYLPISGRQVRRSSHFISLPVFFQIHKNRIWEKTERFVHPYCSYIQQDVCTHAEKSGMDMQSCCSYSSSI